MNYVMVSKTGDIPIGRQGENGRTTAVIDISAYQTEFPNASFAMYHRRENDAEAYPVSGGAVSGTNYNWVISSTDTAQAGIGHAVLYVVQNGVVAKSFRYRTITELSDLVGEDIPDPLTEYASELSVIVSDAEKLTNVSAVVEELASGAPPTATVTQTANQTTFTFGLPVDVYTIDHAVRYDAAQTLTAAQIATVQSNIGLTAMLSTADDISTIIG